MYQVLGIIEKNSRWTYEQVATMTGKSVDEVKAIIKELEDKGVIVGYSTLINWEKTDKEVVMALIEVKVTPQRGEGFDKIAERIYKFPEVKDCYLMSGGFDLTLIIEGKTMKEVASFVSSKLAPLDSVLSTSTHFVLKKYKDKGVIFENRTQDEREAIFL